VGDETFHVDRHYAVSSSLLTFFDRAWEWLRYFEKGMLGFCEGACRWRQFQENCGKVGRVLSIQEVRWSRGDGEGAGDLIFFRQWYKTSQWGLTFFANQRVVSAVKKVEFVSAIMSHIVLGGWWFCDDIPNVPTPTVEKVNTKGGYYLYNYISC
jgi:hypothetical protein